MSARRSKERGSIMVVAMLVLTALVGVGGLTVLSVRGGLAGSGQERFKTMALYAAESGAAVAMQYLRANVAQTGFWTTVVNQSNIPPFVPLDLPGNGAEPNNPNNLFTQGVPGTPGNPAMDAWYEVAIFNNEDDAGFDAPGGVDTDGRVIIEVTGYGPNNVAAQIRWEVRVRKPGEGGNIGLGQGCGGPSGQAGGGADGTGNDCGSAINPGSTGTNKLGNP